MTIKPLVLTLTLFIGFCPWIVSHASAQTTPEPRYFAFVVGVSDYYSKTMEDLSFAAKDATDVGDELETLGYDVTRCVGREASREQIVGQFEAFLKKLAAEKVEPHDVVLILFSGHGQELPTRVEPEGRAAITEAAPYFCAWDAVAYDEKQHSLAGLRAEAIEEKLGLVSINRILDGLEKGNSLNNLLIVDACRSNPAKGKAPQITGSTIRQLPQGISILFAARSGQKSYESVDPNVRNGVFTHYLLQGLRGEAKNNRGQITWMRLVTKVAEDVPEEGYKLAGGRDLVQTPHFVNNSDANIILSQRVLPKALNEGITEMSTSGTAPKLVEPPTELVTVRNVIDMQLVPILGGTFQMGSPELEEGRYNRDEKPRQVTISPFYLSVSEVTQSQYAAVMGKNPSVVRGPQYPVESVSWEDAVRFCQVLSDRPEEKAAGRSYRLPTEAEWEYAARAGQSGPYHFGNQVNLLNNFAWNRANSDQPREVKTKQPNAFGLHDMYGNVYEWCSDWYTPDLDRQAGRDPTGPTTGTERVVRGGSYREDAKMMRSAARLSFTPKEARAIFGFRVVMELSEGR